MQSLTRRRTTKARLRFRRLSFEEVARERGMTTETVRIAEYLGLDKGTYSGVLSGRQDPGGKFVAHVLYTFPGEPFERFFEVVEVAQ
jgi:hypothetical protein